MKAYVLAAYSAAMLVDETVIFEVLSLAAGRENSEVAMMDNAMERWLDYLTVLNKEILLEMIMVAKSGARMVASMVNQTEPPKVVGREI